MRKLSLKYFIFLIGFKLANTKASNITVQRIIYDLCVRIQKK